MHPVRLGDAGAGGRGVRARVRRPTSARRTPAPCRTARPRCTWRCSPSASRPGDEVDHRQPLVHRHRERDPLLRRGAGLRRHRSGDLQHRPGADRGGDHAADAARSCACTRWGCRATCEPFVEIAGRHGLPVIEDAACAIGSEILWNGRWENDRQAARRHRLLLVPPAQGRSPPATAACSRRRMPNGTRSSGCGASTA